LKRTAKVKNRCAARRGQQHDLFTITQDTSVIGAASSVSGVAVHESSLSSKQHQVGQQAIIQLGARAQGGFPGRFGIATSKLRRIVTSIQIFSTPFIFRLSPT
jgi:hypothetical protein